MAHQQPHSGAAQQAARILRSLTAGRPLRIERLAGQSAGCSSLELERRELLESIVESLSANARSTVLPSTERGFCAGGAPPPCQGLSGNTRSTVLPLAERGFCAGGAPSPCQGHSRPPARTDVTVALLRHLAGSGVSGPESG